MSLQIKFAVSWHIGGQPCWTWTGSCLFCCIFYLREINFLLFLSRFDAAEPPTLHLTVLSVPHIFSSFPWQRFNLLLCCNVFFRAVPKCNWRLRCLHCFCTCRAETETCAELQAVCSRIMAENEQNAKTVADFSKQTELSDAAGCRWS